MSTQEEEMGCMFQIPGSQLNDKTPIVSDNSDDLSYFSVGSENQNGSTISTDEDQFYSLGSIREVGRISCRTGDDLAPNLQNPDQDPNTYVQQTTNELRLPFVDQLGGTGNGTPINLNTTLQQFQALCGKVLELRDSNRKILRELNHEENFQRKKKQATERARQEMEAHLKKLEERWKMRQERIHCLKSTLNGISQNVDKLEKIINTQGQKLHSQGHRGQGRRDQDRKRSQNRTNVPMKDGITSNRPNITSAVNGRNTVEKIKRNEIGLKSKTSLGNEDNRIPTLRRKQRKMERQQKEREENRKLNSSASTVSSVNTDNGQLLMEEARGFHQRESKRTSLPRAEGGVPADPPLPEQRIEIIDPNRWTQWANEALQKGRTERRPTGDGPGTVLLLDISASMAGEPFAQMKNIAKQFLRDVKRQHDTGNIGENVALVTFGRQTQVVKYACNDYQGIIHDIEHLQVGGPSPMVGGLYMAMAAAMCCPMRQIRDVTIPARIILISDGDATSEQILSGPDGSSNCPFVNVKDDIHLELLRVANRLDNRVYCVPVGNAETMHLEGISATTNGKVFKPEHIGRLSRMYKNMKYAFDMRSHHENEFMLRLMLQTGVFTGDIEHEDMDDVISFVTDPEYHATIHQEVNENVPCIGTRVRRGPSWNHEDQDKNGPGTVVGQTSNGMVWVQWDTETTTYRKYHCGVNGGLEVVIVEEPRVLIDDQLIAVGCRVKRGKDWRYHDEDGGAGTVGVVFIVNDNSTVAVRWPNKTMKRYKFGNKGYFEVELCETSLRNDGNDGLARTLDDEKRWYFVIDTGQPRLSVEERNQKNIQLTEQSVHELEGPEEKCNDTLSVSDVSIVTSSSDSEVEEVNADHLQDYCKDVESKTSDDEGNAHYKWEYVDTDGNWKAYPTDIVSKIEQVFQRKLHSTTVVHMDGCNYRLLFSKMEQTNTSTRESSKIRRIDCKSMTST